MNWRSFSLLALIILVSMLGFSTQGYARSFDLSKLLKSVEKNVEKVKKVISGVSEEEEQVLGQQSAALLLGAGELVNNRELQEYVNKVGLWVAMQSERPDLKWRFAILNNPNINAFAAPGGYVFITSGLMALIRSEAELAGVLGHEIVHVVERHHTLALKKDARIEVLGKLGKELLHREGKDRRVEDLEKIAGSARDLYTNGLDKKDEFQADRRGIVLAARAGYEPWALLAVLQRLDSLNPDDRMLSLLFKTHPRPAKRLERLIELLELHEEQFALGVEEAERYLGYLRAEQS